jgi:hypothetical protein
MLWLAIYTSDNRPLSILSILNQYFNIDKTIEKYRGYLPSSDNTAKFMDFLFIPKIYLRYLKSDLSIKSLI